MNELLTMRSTDQGGIFTRAEAKQCGIDDSTLRQLVKTGRCVRVARGVYAFPSPQLPPEDQHRRLTRALLRRLEGRAAASHHSALLLHGLPVHGVDLERVHLVGGSPRKVRRLPVATVHRPVEPTLLDSVDGQTLVRVAPALVQNALLHDTMSAVVSADAALKRELVTRDELTAAVATVKGRPGSRTATNMLRFMDGRSESVGETRLRLELNILQIPVVPQFKIVEDGHVIARTDLKVIGAPVVVEFDGLVKYRGDQGERAVIAEKKREDRIRRLGYEVVRVIWPELDHPAVISRWTREAIRRCR